MQTIQVTIMASFDCYTVKSASWLPAYNLAHGLRSACAIRGVLWLPSEETVAFQAESIYTQADVEQLVRMFVGDNYQLEAVAGAAYEDIANTPCVALTSSVLSSVMQ